ncbi:macrophage mannose receptor 1-like [Brachyhypopomus gauderio]|uniref:macrophage mannose receptor 1-like n=1 Tax=Brachyhypopomus gauderio TaxID=698409 RepID=UPI0040418A48
MFSILLLSGLWLLSACLPRHYHFVNQSMTWSEAQSFCRHTHTDLATVDNTEDMNRLLESSNSNYTGSAWIGLHDDVKNSWRWSLEDPQFYKEGERDFRKWITAMSGLSGREPFCVLFYSSTWYIFPCDNTVSFVCFDGSEKPSESLILISDEKNWTEAQNYCREHHTDLASIRNQDENSRIASIVGASFVWIGLYRTRTWSDHSNSSFRYWKTEDVYSELEDLGPSCTAVSLGDDGMWTDESCNITLPFICYSVKPTAFLHHYHFVNESMTWSEAQSFCRHTHTDLATVDNMEDMNRLLESSNSNYTGSAWIGLHDDVKNSWRWSLEDPQFYKEGERDFRKWLEYPRNEEGNDYCGLMLYESQSMYNEKWVDRPCSEERPFVCYDGRKNATATYVPVSEPKNWTDAQSYCREHYLDLASVRNPEENKEIFQRTSESIQIKLWHGIWGVWIGIYRNLTWSDQSKSSFTFWKPGEPDNGKDSVLDFLDQHCTAVSFGKSGEWTDENCLTALPFICYSYSYTAGATVKPLPTSASELTREVINTTRPHATPNTETSPEVINPDPPTSTTYSDLKPPGHVVILNVKVNAQKDLSTTYIEEVVLERLQEELNRLDIQHEFTLHVKSIYKITP